MEERDRPMSTADLAERGGEHAGRPGGGAETTSGPTRTGERGGGTETEVTGRRMDMGRALLGEEQSAPFRRRWEEIQAGFVDEPRQAVEQADTLVAGVMRELASTFSRVRSDLEAQWSRGGDAGTEELRVALQRYRSFFQLLLRH